jgi:hypothetical protein
MAFETKKNVLESVVAEAHEELNTIGAEMQDDFDEKGERWQESDKGQDLVSAAEHFSGLDYPEPPDELKSLDVEYQQVINKNPTRAARRDNAVHALDAVASAVKALEESDANSMFIDDLEQLISDADSMEPIGK